MSLYPPDKFTTNPMMSEEEIKILDDFIENQKPRHCLEWGSGGSTVHFPRHPHIWEWLSIEHNGNYVQFLADKIDSKTTIIWADEAWYIDCIKHGKPKYDLILIDGLQRDRCLEIAKQLLAPGGSIFLHDAGRPEYQRWIEKWGANREVLTEGEKPLKEGGYAHRGLVRFWL